MIAKNISLMVIAFMLAVGAGVWYSSQRFEEGLGKNSTQLSFWLLDQGGELVKFPAKESEKTLIYYMPDNASEEMQQEFMKIVRKRDEFKMQGVRVLPVSRNLRDNLINLKSKSGFWDSIIHDPSGVVQKFFNQFSSDGWGANQWVSALFDQNGKLVWARVADGPIFSP